MNKINTNTINGIKLSFGILACMFGGFLVIIALLIPTDKVFTLNSLKLLFEYPRLLYCVVNCILSVIIVVALSWKSLISIDYIVVLVAFLLFFDFVPIIIQTMNMFRYGGIQFPGTLIILMFHTYILYKLLKSR